ncbi:MAG: hypothetical protein Kow0010_12640 [Dehalococcoidia bacterium]
MTHEGPDDETLFERLHEATGADPALRQIRRRYDSLRADYERLIDRLEEIEARLEASRRAEVSHAPAATPPPATSLTESLTAPLYRLRDEYASALSGIQQIIEGLGDLAHGAFKGQRDSSGHTAPPTRVEPPAPSIHDAGRRRVEVEVRGEGHAAMLGFQERLKAMPGVRRASISAIDDEHATLVVELQPDDTGAEGP